MARPSPGLAAWTTSETRTIRRNIMDEFRRLTTTNPAMQQEIDRIAKTSPENQKKALAAMMKNMDATTKKKFLEQTSIKMF
jgi:hypothetical protein